MTMFHRVEPRPITTAAGRLSREASILVIGALSALCWAILVYIALALCRVL